MRQYIPGFRLSTENNLSFMRILITALPESGRAVFLIPVRYGIMGTRLPNQEIPR